MAIHKNGLMVVLLLAMFCILETGNIIKLLSMESLHQVHSGEQHLIREKRQLVGASTNDVFTEGTTETTFPSETTQAPTTVTNTMTTVTNTQIPEETTVTKYPTTGPPTIVTNATTTQAPTTVTKATTTHAPTTVTSTTTMQSPTTVTNTTTQSPRTVTNATTTQVPTTVTNIMTTQSPTTVTNTPTPEETTVTKYPTTGPPTIVTNATTTQAPTTVTNTTTTQSLTTVTKATTPEETTVTKYPTTGPPTIVTNATTTQAPTTVTNTTTTQSLTTVTKATTTQAPTTVTSTTTMQSPTTVTNATTQSQMTVTNDTTQVPTTVTNIMTTQSPTTVTNTQIPEETTVTKYPTTGPPTLVTNATTTQAPTTVTKATTTHAPTTVTSTTTMQSPTTVTNTTTQSPTTVTNATTTQVQTTVTNIMTTQSPTTVTNTPTPETTTVTKYTTTGPPTIVTNATTTQAPTTVTNTMTTVTNTQIPEETTVTKYPTTGPPTIVTNATTTQAPTTVTKATTTHAPTTVTSTTTMQSPTTVTNTTTQSPTTVTNATTTQVPTTVTNIMTTQSPTTVTNTPTPETTTVTKYTTTGPPTIVTNATTTQAPTTVTNTMTTVTNTQIPEETTVTKYPTTGPPTIVTNATTTQAPTTVTKATTTHAPTTVTNTPTPETTTVTKYTTTGQPTIVTNATTTQAPTTVTNTMTTQPLTTVTKATTTQAPTTVTNTTTPKTTTVTTTTTMQSPTTVTNTTTPKNLTKYTATQAPTTVTNTTTQSLRAVTNATTTQAPTTVTSTTTTQSPTTVTNTTTPKTTTVTTTTTTVTNATTTQAPIIVTNTTTPKTTTVTTTTTTQSSTTVTNATTTQAPTTVTNTTTQSLRAVTNATTTQAPTTVTSTTTTQLPTTVTNTTTPKTTTVTTTTTTVTNATTTQAPTTVTNTTTPKTTTVTTTTTTQSSTTVTNATTTQAPTTVTNMTKTTSPTFDYEYLISVELNVTELSTITSLRNILKNTSYPIDINSNLRISDINITTVCSPSNGDFQCGCEDQYRWSCDQCLLHGSCDNITNNTCEYFPACPPTTTSPTTTSPPFEHEYLISVELNITDLSGITSLRNILKNTNYPIDITSYLKISDINMTTVCSPSDGDFQCRCEDQYRWPCDQCLLQGSCDSITNNTCGCIKGIPLGGQYCQSVDEHNTVCPSTTTFPTTLYTTVTTSSSTTSVTNATTTEAPTTVANTTTTLTTLTNTTTQRTKTVTNTTTTQLPTTVTNTTTRKTTTAKNTTTQPPPTTITTASTRKPRPVNTTVSTTTTTSKTMTTTKATTTKPSTTTPPDPPTTTPETVFQLDFSIRFDRVYTSDLSDPNSSAYKDLASQIRAVLLDQYGGLTGFADTFVTGFRPGSVIADFIVQTSQLDPEDLSVVNQALPEAMRPIARVLGLVAFYRSPTRFITPPVTYTGRSIELTCGPTPASVNLGNIIGTKWKLNGQELKENGRIRISSSATASVVKVSNVILADAGLYECNRIGSAVTFVQNGRAINIRQAPNVRVPSKVNLKCTEGRTQRLKCCVQSNFIVRWFLGSRVLESDLTDVDEVESYCISHRYVLSGCGNLPSQLRFTCRVNNPVGFEETTTMVIFNEDIICNDELYGAGRADDISTIACDSGQEGSRSAECRDTGEWILLEDTCIVSEIKDLVVVSEDLEEEEVPQIAANLSQIVQEEKEQIVNSSATISAIVGILSAIANVSNEVNRTVMENVLETVDIIIGDGARETWEFLRENITRNDSSELLNSLEIISDELIGEFTIRTELILLNTTTFNDSFTAEFNNSVVIDIPGNDRNNLTITTIVFSTLDNVLPPRNSSFNNTSIDTANTSASFDTTINAAVALVRVNTNIQNITLSFKKQNDSLTQNPQCVFWNFTLIDNLGAWDDEGCTLVSDINDTVTCNCNHLTSFSILMATDIPESIRIALDVITYVGVGISIASLIICLIIEAYVWKALTKNSTAFMRHVCIVNTALSLLIADICFIIAAFYAKNPLENPDEDHQVPLGPCTAATFFMHFFYLALFFWMLASGLLLFYRTIMVFSHMSKSAMSAIAFLFGYVCPLIIAVVTVAATAPGNGYIRENDACWLNWTKTKALLALVIPALTVVFINFVIVIVIMFKMLRRGTVQVTRPDEKHSLLVVARCVIILTPLFGLTWALGVGTMISSTNEGIHIAFAFFNSLQGFFILVFGTLLDSKIRAVLSKKLPALSSGSGSNQTASTSAGVSTSSAPKWLQKLRGKRYVYRVSEAGNTSSSSGTESYSNI
ncbi:uncharacterized protein ACBT44_000394 isoform 2-T2 [Syngnathus typhle]